MDDEIVEGGQFKAALGCGIMVKINNSREEEDSRYTASVEVDYVFIFWKGNKGFNRWLNEKSI